MKFNTYQNRIWLSMINTIENFRCGGLPYTMLVSELEGALETGDFKDETLILEWYNLWTPLEILNATKGDATTIFDADKYLLKMLSFLQSKLNSEEGEIKY